MNNVHNIMNSFRRLYVVLNFLLKKGNPSELLSLYYYTCFLCIEVVSSCILKYDDSVCNIIIYLQSLVSLLSFDLAHQDFSLLQG